MRSCSSFSIFLLDQACLLKPYDSPEGSICPTLGAEVQRMEFHLRTNSITSVISLIPVVEDITQGRHQHNSHINRQTHEISKKSFLIHSETGDIPGVSQGGENFLFGTLSTATD